MSARPPVFKVIDSRGRWNERNEDEMQWWPRVLWIDPGVVSGVACLWFDPVALFEDKPMSLVVLAYHEEFLSGPENGTKGQVHRFLARVDEFNGDPGLAIGVERFIPRQVNYDEDFLSAVRIRAGIEYGLSIRHPGRRIHLQQPADALKAFTVDRLKLLRLHTPGPDHVNDAKAHCLLHIRRIHKAGREVFEQVHGTEEGWWS